METVLAAELSSSPLELGGLSVRLADLFVTLLVEVLDPLPGGVLVDVRDHLTRLRAS
jgi:hypothetical protein